jgi:hypothetical protein
MFDFNKSPVLKLMKTITKKEKYVEELTLRVEDYLEKIKELIEKSKDDGDLKKLKGVIRRAERFDYRERTPLDQVETELKEYEPSETNHERIKDILSELDKVKAFNGLILKELRTLKKVAVDGGIPFENKKESMIEIIDRCLNNNAAMIAELKNKLECETKKLNTYLISFENETRKYSLYKIIRILENVKEYLDNVDRAHSRNESTEGSDFQDRINFFREINLKEIIIQANVLKFKELEKFYKFFLDSDSLKKQSRLSSDDSLKKQLIVINKTIKELKKLNTP